MNIIIEEAGTCRKTVKVEVPAEKVQEVYNKALAEFSQVARIKGFRPGKAPLKVVEKRYAKDILKAVRDELVPTGYQQAVKEHNLNVLGVINLDEPDITVGAPCTFSFTVEVEPEFTLPNYKGIPLARQKAEVTDERVEETITAIQEQFGSFEEVSERPVAKGDLVQINYEGICEGNPIDNIGAETKGLGKREDFWVRADENAFLPEFADGLIGAQPGEKKQVLVDFPDDFTVEALRGKQATYFVDVKAIREKKLPERDAAFFERLGLKDEAQLRERIQEDLKQRAEQQEAGRLRNEVIENVLKQVEMDLPPSAVAHETQKVVQDIVRDQTSRGTKQDQLVEQKEEIMEAAGRNAENRVKAQFVLDRIAKQESIEPNAAQIRNHVDRMAASYGMSPDALRKELKKREAMDTVTDELRRSMAVDFLLAQAQISEAQASDTKEK